MRLLLFIILVSQPVYALKVDHIADKATGFSAIAVFIPSGENSGFSVIDVPEKLKKDNIINYWKPPTTSVIFNGGYFEQDFSPSGYYRVNGKTVSSKPLKKLSGFVVIDKNGTISLLTAKDNYAKYPTVIQAGPYVIDPGGRIGIRSRTGKKARRTLIGLSKNKTLIILTVTSKADLFDLTHIVKKQLPDIERLLNLDGGPSVALLTEQEQIVNHNPVRNYIVKDSKKR